MKNVIPPDSSKAIKRAITRRRGFIRYLCNTFQDVTAAPAATAIPYGRRRVKGFAMLSSG